MTMTIILLCLGVTVFSVAITLHLSAGRTKARDERDVALKYIGRIARGK